ncbi:D-glycero-D-manno-heptose 1,7-bisphosphate phosphatase [Lachnospiraceae bacterium XBB1006]|nr:D-glycero-D-manno-heptose 1,7-bisphosphate phosphatase [Lachnospiraceae bacterium XBB1006]
MKKAVFLDRDGVLCEDTDYVTSFEKFHIFPWAKEAVDIIHQKGYMAIVVTNQSAIARGMMTEALLLEMNDYLKEQTGVDDIFYCPHLPPDEKEIKPYRIFCNCRKPLTGMIDKASEKYKIDLTESYMIGDREKDIEMGRCAGVTSVLVGEASTEKWNLLEAIKEKVK